ncbi:MAG: hypothetical protein WBC02_07025 [Candidatus Aminicenantaceae bacterium]
MAKPQTSKQPERDVMRYDLVSIDRSKLYLVVENREIWGWELLVTDLERIQ